MTSKRLGFVVLALVAVWSFGGLNWLAPSAGEAPHAILTVSTAQAGYEDFLTGCTTTSLDGDPDQYTNGPDGDPDEYAGSSGADSTGSQTDEPEDGSGGASTREGSWIQTVIDVAGAIYDATQGLRY